MQVVTASRRGHRDSNDDVVMSAGSTVVLCDGIGGQRGGAAAATVSSGTAIAELVSLSDRSVRLAFHEAQSAVRKLQLSEPEYAEAGTTMTIVGIRYLPVRGVSALVGHMGDSPAFRIAGGELELLTRPHTIAEDLRSEGRITDEQATQHPGRNTLSRSVGAIAGGEPEIQEVDLSEGDRILVCSDGLLDVPDRRRLRELATRDVEVSEVVDGLVEYALQHSRDNVTVAILDPWVDEDAIAGHRHD